MKLIPIYLIIIFLFNSCASRKFNNHEVQQTINTITLYKDTTIFIPLPGDTVYLEAPAIPGSKSKLETNLATSEAWIEGDVLKHRLVQKDTVIDRTIRNAVKTTVLEKEKIVTQRQKSWPERLQVSNVKLVLWVVVILLVIIVVKFLKGLIR